jgi:hypothetical protein
MERRSFLQGIITSIAASSVIVQASDSEIARFGLRPGESTVLQPGALSSIPKPRPGQYWPAEVSLPGGKWLLYNHRGEAVAAVMRVYRNEANPVTGATMECAALDGCHEWLMGNQAIDERNKRQGRG